MTAKPSSWLLKMRNRFWVLGSKVLRSEVSALPILAFGYWFLGLVLTSGSLKGLLYSAVPICYLSSVFCH
jgi:hypothetical protein